ncbi:type I restriction-modification enzyme R subunit C-terminal domain-containing protein [Pseudolysinimonas kribbensis]|uniref:Type III restriction endonuclease subunit R n=1 Tax=Pseudolysinimonas kribbensis TaxID=433641 RepID=A0ABQ6K299_9MICO|nr:DEAD/DEAH box helicase family protein [Pseudolysinimonas kribbensis]GMA93693.1 type III restriction endonuclease subunit R [Pseudolysinimonas kribbensis]
MHTAAELALAAEQRARVRIDAQLRESGWDVQDAKQLNLFAGPGVAVREVVMAPGHGRVDYLLYVDREVVGVIEAKPEGTTLSGVEWQSAMYANGLPEAHRKRSIQHDGRLPFVFEASGSESHFTNGMDPDPRARRLFQFPRPETLAALVRDGRAAGDGPATWRGKVRRLPPLTTESLRPAQITAVDGIERSLAEQRFDRSLVQMATGAGKTFTAVTEAYRLLTWGGFRRVLFLVDRNNLGDQTLGEFQNYRTPGDGRRFTELYAVQKLTGAGMLASSNVVISTIQRVHRVLQGREVVDVDDPGVDDFVPDAPVTVAYNPELPPEAFDLVIVDEAHRSIYGVWRSVLEYFDAHVVGLTATPTKQTFGFFQSNLVSEYTYPESVADNVNVDFDIYRIRTRITGEGDRIEAGTFVPKVDRRTREKRIEALDDDLVYTSGQLDRAVTSTSQLRLVLKTFRDRLFTEIFPGRSTVPKTLIFCKDDNHAEEVVTTVRQVFGRGNDFAAKITYNAKDPKGALQAFRTSPTLRIAVTVDMIATGTDVKPLECVFFMRDVRSAQYFEQMKGRGARTIAQADFRAVTPDAVEKTRFVIVDAVGVTEHDFVEPPLNREKGVSLEKLLQRVANLTITEDETATLASRLSALELQLTPAERAELDEVAGGSLRGIVQGLVHAVSVDAQAEALAAAGLDLEAASEPARIAVVDRLIEASVEPLVANPELRSRILELRRSHDQVIDEVSVDELLGAGGVVDTDRARTIVESWRDYLDENRDEIAAIQLVDEARRSGAGHVSFAAIQELAERIKRPPHNWTPEVLWTAYEAVERSRVRGSGNRQLTDLVSLLRFALGADAELVPFADAVHARYAAWLAQQEQEGVVFTDAQRWWLDRMAEVVASSAELTPADLELAPFSERGGQAGAVQALGAGAAAYVRELGEVLAG